MSGATIGVFGLSTQIFWILAVIAVVLFFVSTILFYFSPTAQDVRDRIVGPAMLATSFTFYVAAIGLLAVVLIGWWTSGIGWEQEKSGALVVFASLVLAAIWVVVPLWVWHDWSWGQEETI